MLEGMRPLTRGCVSDFSGAATTLNQLRGTGIVRNKSLIIPFHFGRNVSSIEYVQLEPGASVGEHEQEVDELYFLMTGAGQLTTNGEMSDVQAEDLVLAPRFTRHSIQNTHDIPLDFLVIEVRTSSYVKGEPTTITDLPSRFQSTKNLFPARLRGELAELLAVTIDLRKHFTGSWDHLSLIELPAACRLDAYCVPEYDENLLVYSGHGAIEVDGREFLTDEEARYGLNAYVPAGIRRRIINRSSVDPLRVLSVRFRQESK
ncbi:MAG TPA: cupin domain-containing protein [Ktedonobacteraceae bacterium]|nr:cupin domain-containing protein [Ktedonobacteraceae bacterium]HZT98209.1 cupin domain-containing protein [Ktedonobacteraceae bacterium]